MQPFCGPQESWIPAVLHAHDCLCRLTVLALIFNRSYGTFSTLLVFAIIHKPDINTKKKLFPTSLCIISPPWNLPTCWQSCHRPSKAKLLSSRGPRQDPKKEQETNGMAGMLPRSGLIRGCSSGLFDFLQFGPAGTGS